MKLLLQGVFTLLLAFNTVNIAADDASVMCMAKNIYYEARGESTAGKLAVAKVTLNRVGSSKFPNSVCSVVYQKHQFSWTKNAKHIITDKEAWAESMRLAQHAISTGLLDIALPALYFHNSSISPKWGKKQIAKIGKHHFYK